MFSVWCCRGRTFPRREATRLRPAFLSSSAFFCSSSSWGRPTSAVLNLCSEHGSFTLARAGAHAWSNKVARVPGEVVRLPGSVMTSHHPHPPGPRASCPHTSTSHISAHPTPWPVLWVPCHHFVKKTGHLGREEAAVLLPRASSIHSLHTHTHRGSLYLTNNYLTKYANSIITVICLAVISV